MFARSSGNGTPIGRSSDGLVYHTLPHYMGTTFTKTCKLWQIVNEIALAYYFSHRSHSSGPNQSSLGFAETKYQQLLHVADGLGDDKVGWNETSHHENIFR